MPLSVGLTLSAFAVEVWLCASSCEASSKLNVQSPEIHLVLIVVRRVPRYRCFPKVEEMKNAQFLLGGHHLGREQALPDRGLLASRGWVPNRPEKARQPKILQIYVRCGLANMTAGNRFTICALVASAFSVCSLDSKFFGCFLNTFKDAKVTFRARTECLKRLLVRLAFVCRERDI